MTDDLVERARPALAVALPAALGAELADPEDPTAGVVFTVAGLALTPAGTLHASALGAVVELAAYLAVLPTLDDAEHAVTHATATQLLRAAGAGERVHAVGSLDKRGPSPRVRLRDRLAPERSRARPDPADEVNRDRFVTGARRATRAFRVGGVGGWS